MRILYFIAVHLSSQKLNIFTNSFFVSVSLYLVECFSAFCRVQRTPMRFRADAVQSTTDALKQCIFSYSRGFITTV